MSPNDASPFFLADATLELYLQGGDGSPEGSALFGDVCVNGFRASHNVASADAMASGALYLSGHSYDDDWRLDLERTWLLPATGESRMTDFLPDPSLTYVLVLAFAKDGATHRRTFYNCTLEADETASRGALHSDRRQTWRSTHWEQAAA